MSGRSPNLRPSLLMIGAMALFATEDVLIKFLSARYSVGHVLMIIGALASMGVYVQLRIQGQRLFTRALLNKALVLRNLGELIGTFGFVYALTSTQISLTTAIFQATPLAVVLGAAMFLGEALSLRKILSVILGLVGVLLILRPGTLHFDPNALFALQAVGGLAIRDIATRRVPTGIPSAQISAFAFLMDSVAGLVWILITGRPLWVSPQPIELGYWLGATTAALLGYSALVAATRSGQLSVVVFFRYSRLLFAMLYGLWFFGERPDRWTLFGSALIVLGGALALRKPGSLGSRRPSASP